MLALPAASAGAADGWGGALGVASDAVFRGVSQSNRAAAVQIDGHWRLPQGWFVGAWASTGPTEPEPIGRYELNLYAGRSWQLAERWGLSARYVHYLYPNSTLGRRYDYDELAVSLDYEDRLALSLAASPNTTRYSATRGLAEGRRTVSLELSGRQPLVGALSLVASAGWYDTQALFGSRYAAWNLGLSTRLGPFDVTVARFGVNASARRLFGSAAADGRWVLTASLPF